MKLWTSLISIVALAACTDDGGGHAHADAPVFIDGAGDDGAGDGAAIDAAIDAPPDAGVDPNAFPEPIFIDPLGSLSAVYAVDPISRRAVVYTYKQFDDEATDNFARDLGVVGGGMPSYRIPFGTSPWSAVVADNGHLRIGTALIADPDTGAMLYNAQAVVYDVTDAKYTRWLGDPMLWGGLYPTLSGDGQHVVYDLHAAPNNPAYHVNSFYELNLGNLADTPGRVLPGPIGNTAVQSHDGHMIVFHSYDPLVAADTDATDDVYAYDVDTMTIYLVSTGDADPFVPPSIGDAPQAGYRIAYHQPPSAPGGKGSIVVCQLLTQTAPGCIVAAPNAIDCPSGTCVASVSVAPHGRWLSFGTLQPIDPVRDGGALSDQYRIDLDKLFAGLPMPAPRMMTPTPPGYTSPVSTRFDAQFPHMNDDGSVIFLDTFDHAGLGIWISPAY